MQIKFYKYQGTGNDFVLIDNRTNEVGNLSTEHIKKICHRKFGIGADGLMLLNTREGYDFEMKYYNADGNESSMCGNGGRCIVRFAYDLGMHNSTYKFWAIDGLHLAEFDKHENVRLKMGDVTGIDEHSSYTIVNTGSPHFVKFAPNVANIDVVESGRDVRYSKAFEKEGINVNYVERLNEDSIFVRTYERGVEDETLSCGTGVTAAALLSAHNENGFNEVTVKTLGGMLAVQFEKHQNEKFDNIWLIGAANFVYKGEIEI